MNSTAPRPTDHPQTPTSSEPDKTAIEAQRGAPTLEELDLDVKRIVLLGIRLGAMYAGNLCRCNREGLLPGETECPDCRQ